MVLLYLDKCTCINKQKKEEVKEEFYNQLEQNVNQIAISYIKITHGDFNAKVGKEDIYTNLPLAMKVYIMKPTTI